MVTNLIVCKSALTNRRLAITYRYHYSPLISIDLKCANLTVYESSLIKNSEYRIGKHRRFVCGPTVITDWDLLGSLFRHFQQSKIN